MNARASQEPGIRDGAAELQIDELFRNQAPGLRRFVRHIVGERGEADDVVQEAFLRIWRKAQDGHLRYESKAYLFQAALNIARDVLRHRRRAGAIFTPSDQNSADPTASAFRQVAGREALEKLSSCLGELREFTRAVFLLHHVERLSVPALAARTGKTTRTVERHLARALSHCTLTMRSFLEEA